MRFFSLILVLLISLQCSKKSSEQADFNSFDFSQTDLETGIQLQTSAKNFNKIQVKRLEALKRNHLLKNDSDFVKAILRCNGKKAKVKIRLKGEEVDHLQGNQWSFRVSSKKNFVGQRKFSVQPLHTKDYLKEWLFQSWAKDLGIVGLDYFFVPFSINDTLQGIYAFEGLFDPQILQNAHRPKGVILKFDEGILWEQKQFLGHNNRDSILMVKADIVLCNKNLIEEEINYESQYLEAKAKLDAFRNGKLSPSKVFDYPLWSKYFALSELLGSNHNLRWINLRFYFNPITKLFEPIAFDCFSNGGHGDRITQIWFLNERHEEIIELFLRDERFKKQVQKQLLILCDKQQIRSFFHQHHQEISKNIKIIKQQKPDYFFDKNPVLTRAEYLYQYFLKTE